MNRLPIVCSLLCFCIFLAACSRQVPEYPVYSATAFEKINPAPGQSFANARRQALLSAEIKARQQIQEQVIQLELNDGRALSQLAVSDPFVHAKIKDTVRMARIQDRTLGEDGVVTLTVSLNLEPLYKMMQRYPY